MTGPAPAVAAARLAVRAELADLTRRAHQSPGAPAPLVLAAVSGGADSVALAAALAFEAPRAGVTAGAVTVDHGWHADSAEIAERTAELCRALGLDPVVVRRTPPAPAHAEGGPEAVARAGRLQVFDDVAAELGAAAVLLGHTLDDQAETVLLGLVRGAGARSLAGMAARRGLLRRPLLALRRRETEAACEAQKLPVWHDPANDDPRYTRVRVRASLERLEGELGPGVAAALARTAAQLREDADALDDEGRALLARARVPGEGPPERWAVAALREAPRAVRARALLFAVRAAGAPAGDVGARHVAAALALVEGRSGRAETHLPGGLRLLRRGGAVWLTAPTGTARR